MFMSIPPSPSTPTQRETGASSRERLSPRTIELTSPMESTTYRWFGRLLAWAISRDVAPQVRTTGSSGNSPAIIPRASIRWGPCAGHLAAVTHSVLQVEKHHHGAVRQPCVFVGPLDR